METWGEAAWSHGRTPSGRRRREGQRRLLALQAAILALQAAILALRETPTPLVPKLIQIGSDR